ncbi:BTB/POZ domain-containing protein 17 [Latimeria chalumnae]|uniref:BTB/POZ domain-containing protein 17 n=1 Tax=Latimeria chalumnae TaxID=7897 RepID=UPI00313D55E2
MGYICILATLLLQALTAQGAQKSDLSPENAIATINHTATLIRHLQALLNNGNYSDIILKVHTTNSDEVKVFYTHHLLLVLQSQVLENMLQNQTVLTLQEPADCAALFEKFIRYLYCGEIIILLDQAIPLHKLASKYQVAELQQGVSDFMVRHLASESSQGHVISWYHYAVKMGDDVLQDSCLQFLAWNLSTVIHSGEWSSISDDLMVSLVQRSDLVILNEVELYNAVEEWISRNQPDVPIIQNVLRSIRYTMISPSHLFHLQKQSPVMVKHYNSVQDLLFIAFQFHSASPLQFAKYFDVNCSMFIPRNYLSSSWGSPWVINNPARDDRSTSFQTQLGPSNHDLIKKVTWNVLFSPRWLPVSLRPVYADPGPSLLQSIKPEDSRPRLIITPATSSPEFAGVSFQKTVLIGVKQHGKIFVKHVYNFHQSTDEAGDFLINADIQKRSSEYLIDNSLHLHLIIKPIYQPLVRVRK